MYKRKVDDRWSFKEANTKEFTHCYHTYPAMMIPQIARTLIEKYKPKGRLDLILDPYMGSGTTLVEASLAGINSIGTDLNPLARLMGKVKTTLYNNESILKQFREIQTELIFYTKDKVKERNFDRISNYSFWYNEDTLLKLSYLSQLIKNVKDKDFFNVVLSEVVREVSFTRNGEFKRYRMNEASIAKFNPDTFTLFEKKALRNIEGLKAYTSEAKHNVNASIYDFNTMYGIPTDIIKDGDVDMVVTSPPYGDSRTTVAYGQFSRWANEWFNFDNAKNLDKLLMGGKKATEEIFKTASIRDVLDEIDSLEHKRYLEVVSFLNDYYQSIENVAKSVRSGGTVCYVVGDRRVKGVQIPLDYFTAEMFEKFGFKHKITIVREIPNKRMPALTSPTNKAGAKVSTMSHEYIVILNKL
ncbi:DNA methylase [Segatella buccae]|jgi:DNA modification methylase|uniref:site-specific DNA-methyltransferase (cytosine-N(4)-specific) n=1 Tax=Segatella buccae TaxID=28126 RepID=A0AAQ1ZHH8_9BACT|nr:DNA methyltransferase [Segatella buccae]MBW4872167.1 site-specific DNA-methyltransferase [Segatella buccae]SUB78793.1 DNA methylase [Segatella buccae]DAT66911.1 MAG TPA: adenine-specific methyltransferase [Caudoviricetes sp.]